MKKLYRQAVSALVLRPAEVCTPDGCDTVYDLLLVHKPRKRDAWQIPQGGIEEGETLEEAAMRELKEETDLDVSDVLHTSERSYTYDFPPQFIARHKPRNQGQSLKFVSFLIDPSSQVHVDKNEVDRHVWIRPGELRRYIRRSNYADVIEEVLEEALRAIR